MFALLFSNGIWKTACLSMNVMTYNGESVFPLPYPDGEGGTESENEALDFSDEGWWYFLCLKDIQY